MPWGQADSLHLPLIALLLSTFQDLIKSFLDDIFILCYEHQ